MRVISKKECKPQYPFETATVELTYEEICFIRTLIGGTSRPQRERKIKDDSMFYGKAVEHAALKGNENSTTIFNSFCALTDAV